MTTHVLTQNVNQQSDWRLIWLKWVLATSLGVALAALLMTSYSAVVQFFAIWLQDKTQDFEVVNRIYEINYYIQPFLNSLLAAMAIGICQWLIVLRKHEPRSHLWIWLTVAGMLLGNFIEYPIRSVIHLSGYAFPYYLVFNITDGIILGAVQWRFLRRYNYPVRWWLIAVVNAELLRNIIVIQIDDANTEFVRSIMALASGSFESTTAQMDRFQAMYQALIPYNITLGLLSGAISGLITGLVIALMITSPSKLEN